MTDVELADEDMARMYLTVTSWDEVAERAAARATAQPQEMYRDLSARCPVVHNENGAVTLLRMEDVLFVNKSRKVEQSAKFLGSNRPAIPLGLDGAEHTKYRRLLDPVFTAKRVAPLTDQVRSLANKMIDAFIDHHEVDAYREWCEPLPSQVFLSIMGLPMQDLPGFLRFKELTLGNEALERMSPDEIAVKRAKAVEWIQGYFNRSLDEREDRGEPGDDMLGWLLNSEVAGERLSRENIHDILGLLIIAGLDTVAASLACFLSYFARHPEQRVRLVAEQAGWPSAVRSSCGSSRR